MSSRKNQLYNIRFSVLLVCLPFGNQSAIKAGLPELCELG
jgi:hypothetical protein